MQRWQNTEQAHRTAIKSAEGRKERRVQVLSHGKLFPIRRQILHFGHIWHCFTWNYVFAFHAQRSGPAQLGNCTRSTRYAMAQVSSSRAWCTCTKHPKISDANVGRPGLSLFRRPCRINSCVVMQPAVHVEPPYSARLFLALRTELRLLEGVNLWKIEFLGKGRQTRTSCTFIFSPWTWVRETNDSTAHFINLSILICLTL